jgi:hypothetical protein
VKKPSNQPGTNNVEMQSRAAEIISGWTNLVFQSPEIETLAKARIMVCAECPQLTQLNFCSLCNCYMPAKTRNERSRCPDGKW